MKVAVLLSSLLVTLIGMASPDQAMLDDLSMFNIHDRTLLGRQFRVRGHIVSYYRRLPCREWVFCIKNESGSADIYELNSPTAPAINISSPKLNDLVELQGLFYEYKGCICPGYKSVRLLSHNPPPHQLSDPVALFSNDSLSKLYKFRGMVLDSFRDESDRNFIFMTLSCNSKTLHAMIFDFDEAPFDPAEYIGAEICAVGVGSDAARGLRKYMGRVLVVSGMENIEVIKRPETQVSIIPNVDSLELKPPSEFSSLGKHQAVGMVLATWHGDSTLIRTPKNNIVKVCFITGHPPPPGNTIRAFGLPETDLYFINLVHATWTNTALRTRTPDTPTDTTTKRLLFSATHKPQINVQMHGKTIRLNGIIRYLPQTRDQNARIHIESDGHLVPIDISENLGVLDGLTIGCTVSASGVCVMDIPERGRTAITPQALGFFLVPRTPGDIVVLSRPSWWTPVRLLIVIGALVLLIAAILIWNTALKRLAERRGRELADEQVKSVTSELKVYERTHLAVELHDSLSQTLSGVSMQIDAVQRFAGTDPARMNQHLGIAAKALKSCRDELRNCLLDLRSNALEEPDMNATIRKTLEPYLDDADIAIRFFIPREIFSDNTTHTVLRIVRELVVNALRHGHAGKIWIAGSIENRTLKFSVRDNGHGFEPDGAPGIAEGHFGLQGIRERIDELGGTFEIASTPGKGTKAAVSIPLPHDSMGEDNV